MASSSSSSASVGSSLQSSDENAIPNCTSRWDISIIDKMGVSTVKKNAFELIKKEMCLCVIDDKMQQRIDEMVDECSLECLDFESLEDIQFDSIKPYKIWRQRFIPRCDVPELKLFKSNCEEFGHIMFGIMKKYNSTEVKREPCEAEYQILFEKFLRLFEIKTWGQPIVHTHYAKIFGHNVSSKADILCTRSNDPEKILSVCEVKSTCEVAADYSPPQKKLRSYESGPGEEATSSFDLPFRLNAHHVGELLVYFEKSIVKDGLLGMLIEKTCVRFTFLRVSEESCKKIREHSKAGSVKYGEYDEKPRLVYTQRLNYLKKDDRKVLFKALLTLKMMEVQLDKLKK